MTFAITSFNFGVADANGNCGSAGDYVALDTDGVYDYDTSSTRLCGDLSGNLPTVTSQSNTMGLLVNGIQGGPIQASFDVSFS